MNTRHDPGPLEQLRHAAQSPAALTLGALIGAFVPCSTFLVVHVGQLLSVDGLHVTAAPVNHPGWALVAGGLAFSATTVYRWGCSAFRPSVGELSVLELLYTHCKALGFVLLVEGVLLLSPNPELRYVALGLLVLINALGTGAALALRDHADRAAVEPVAPMVAEPVELVAPSTLNHHRTCPGAARAQARPAGRAQACPGARVGRARRGAVQPRGRGGSWRGGAVRGCAPPHLGCAPQRRRRAGRPPCV